MRRGTIPAFIVMALVAGVLGYSTVRRVPPRQQPSRTVPVVVVQDGDPVPHLARGTQLNIVMTNTADSQSRCWDMGGTPAATGQALICQGVDY